MSGNDSTLKATYDKVTGGAQEMAGSLIGSGGDQTKGQAKKDKAEVEHDISHTAAKGPGFTVTPSGAAKDHPDVNQGKWDQTMGSAKEFAGGMIGSEGLKQQGRQQNVDGQEQEAAGQVKQGGQGIADRVTGTIGSAGASLLGNESAKAEYQEQRDSGKAAQRGVEAELQKKAEADAEARK